MPEPAGDQGDTGTASTTMDGGGSGSNFTQADVDRIVADRLTRQKAQIAKQYEGFDDIKAKAAKYDEAEEGRKTARRRVEAQSSEDRGRVRVGVRRAVAQEFGHDVEIGGEPRGILDRAREAHGLALQMV